jgi:hypothetical protein
MAGWRSFMGQTCGFLAINNSQNGSDEVEKVEQKADKKTSETPSRKASVSEKPILVSGIIVFTIILMGYAFTAPPWFPTERLTIYHSRPVTAYVLSGSGRYFAVMQADSRKILYLPQQSIASRALCYNKLPIAQKSLLELVAPNRPGYSECPR